MLYVIITPFPPADLILQSDDEDAEFNPDQVQEDIGSDAEPADNIMSDDDAESDVSADEIVDIVQGSMSLQQNKHLRSRIVADQTYREGTIFADMNVIILSSL